MTSTPPPSNDGEREKFEEIVKGFARDSDGGIYGDREVLRRRIERALEDVEAKYRRDMDALARQSVRFENDREYNAGLVRERDATIAELRKELLKSRELWASENERLENENAQYKENEREFSEAMSFLSGERTRLEAALAAKTKELLELREAAEGIKFMVEETGDGSDLRAVRRFHKALLNEGSGQKP